jgi:hypothetical protein
MVDTIDGVDPQTDNLGINPVDGLIHAVPRFFIFRFSLLTFEPNLNIKTNTAK